MEFLGTSIIGFRDGNADNAGDSGNGTFQAFAPATGQKIEPAFHSATAEEVDLAVRLAAEASIEFGRVSGAKKAEFLEMIAARIEAQTESLVTRANQESALSPARLQSETGRTCTQLRMFAKVVREGSWVTARIDRADPQRKPEHVRQSRARRFLGHCAHRSRRSAAQTRPQAGCTLDVAPARPRSRLRRQ